MADVVVGKAMDEPPVYFYATHPVPRKPERLVPVLGVSREKIMDDKEYYRLALGILEADNKQHRDIDLARKYLDMAKVMGHPDAERILAILALQDEPQNQAALELLERHHARNVATKAQYGMMLANLIIPHLNDVERGMDLLQEAYAQGSIEAAYALYQYHEGKSYELARPYLLYAARQGHSEAIRQLAMKNRFHD